MSTFDRLFGFWHAFDQPATVSIVIGVVALLATAPLVAITLHTLGIISDALRREILVRTLSWLVIAAIILVPVLAGAFWTMLLVFVLALLCYDEYSRVTGLFRERLVSWAVILSIGAIFFAVLDHWYGFFNALVPICMAILAAIAILPDQPKGYVQRTALAVFGFFLFGVCLGHLAFVANSAVYRPLVLILILAVALNDVAAFCAGKAFGKHKLRPNTSPNKTIEGSVGAVVITTTVVVALGLLVADHARVMWLPHLVALGLIVSVGGQLGDLMLSSIKRDVGIKDTGSIIPGHGGLLDRCNSLLLVAPAVFHYVRFFEGLGLGQNERIITGG